MYKNTTKSKNKRKIIFIYRAQAAAGVSPICCLFIFLQFLVKQSDIY